MKNIDKKYIHIGIVAFLVAAATITFAFILFHPTTVIGLWKNFVNSSSPILWGLILGYLLAPVCNCIEGGLFWLYKRTSKLDLTKSNVRKRTRKMAIAITMLLTLWVLYVFFSVIIQEMVVSIQSIVAQSSVYADNLQHFAEKILASNANLQSTVEELVDTYSDSFVTYLNNNVLPQMNGVITSVSLSVFSVLKGIWHIIIGLVISIYVLGSKENFAGQAKKIIYAIFKEETANNLLYDVRYANRTFGAYISGKLLDSLIIGILCYLLMLIIGMPYTILISVIIGITNIIPFFGPFIGGIPCGLFLLVVNPIYGLEFGIMILCLQQFDGNILGPKILGDSTGLDSFWVIFAITIFGAYFGVVGMAIGVPVFALIYAALRRHINRRLLAKGLDINTANYRQLDRIEDGVMIELTKEQIQNNRKKIDRSETPRHVKNAKKHTAKHDESESSSTEA